MGHRRTGRTAAPARADRGRTTVAPGALVVAREARLATIAGLQGGSQGSGFLLQAHALLTRSWARASWRARNDILRAVDFLISAERSSRLASQPLAEHAVSAVK